MMRFAKKEELPKVIELWREAFEDTQEEIEDFFVFCKELARICIWEEEGDIKAQLILLPVTIVCGKEYAAEYIYAVAAKKSFRGQGFATKLLQETRELLGREKKAGLLVPAKESLIGFYEERGFDKCFSDEKYTMTLSSKDDMTVDMTEVSSTCHPLDFKEISVDMYRQLRQRAFCDNGFVDLPLQMLSYAIKSVYDVGGKCVQIVCKDKTYGVLYRQDGTEIQVFEITAHLPEEIRAVAKLLLDFFAPKGVERVTVRQSYLTMGMHLPKDLKETSIFNLVLD